LVSNNNIIIENINSKRTGISSSVYVCWCVYVGVCLCACVWCYAKV